MHVTIEGEEKLAGKGWAWSDKEINGVHKRIPQAADSAEVEGDMANMQWWNGAVYSVVAAVKHGTLPSLWRVFEGTLFAFVAPYTYKLQFRAWL